LNCSDCIGEQLSCGLVYRTPSVFVARLSTHDERPQQMRRDRRTNRNSGQPRYAARRLDDTWVYMR